ELINNNNVSQVAIDEAHCVSEWRVRISSNEELKVNGE
ncbi:hypothetical protein QEU_0559, partial [Clostridioides difficile CD159]